MTIRKCTPNDVTWLVKMAKVFNNEYHDVPLDVDKAHSVFGAIVQSGVALRSEYGAIIGAVVPDPLRDWNVLVELGWYSKDSSGLRLLREFERTGAALGVDEIRMTTLASNPRVAVSGILERRGYNPLETTHSLYL